MKRSWSAVIFLLVFVLFFLFLLPKIMHVRQLQERSRSLESELVKIKRSNLKLEEELRLLREDPVYLEKIAREKFNKVKEGEIVYRVVREGEPAETR